MSVTQNLLRNLFPLPVILITLAAPVRAQDRTDPTAAPTALADALRAQLAEFRTISIQALAVGDDDDGVAILSAGSARAVLASAVRTMNADNLIVRAGSAVIMETSGIPLRLVVKSVTSKGVEIEAPTLAEKLFIPGSFKALAPTNGVPHASLRYLECRDLPVETLLRLVADQTSANLSASANASQETVSIFLRNVSADQAVEEICRTRGLWFRKDETTGITRVTTMAEYEENLASFSEESIESFTLLYPNVLEVASVIYGLYPERVMLSLGEEQILNDETRDISRRFERLNTFASGSSSGLLDNMGGSGGGGGFGGGGFSGSGFGGGTVSALGNTVYSTARNSENRIDHRNRQTFGKLTPSDAKALDKLLKGTGSTNATDSALDAYTMKNASIFVTVSRRNNLIIVRTGDPKVMSEIRGLVRRLDVPTPMVLLEVKILQLTLDDRFTSSFEYEFNKAFRQNSPSPVTTKGGFPGFESLSDNVPDPNAMTFKVLSEHLNVRIQMLQENGQAKTLATPTLLTANSEVSRLFIGEERPMIENVDGDVVVNDDNVVISPTVTMERRPIGTLLLITPNINADRTVTLRVFQENSKVKKNDAIIPLFPANGGGVVNFPIDVVSARSIAGTFVAKDELTVAAGGLIEEEEVLSESKVPVLGSIPYLGWFFRSEEKVKTRSELIILIKPHVISTPSEGESISRRVTEGLSAHPARDGRSSLGFLNKTPAENTGNAKTSDRER